MWRAATIAGYLAAAACGSSTPKPDEPVGNEAGGAAVAPERPDDGECERATKLPASVGGPAAGVFRGIVVGGDGLPVERAQVSVGGGSRTESHDGHTVTTIAGVSQTYSHSDGGFRFESIRSNMVNVNVVWNGVTVRCLRGSEDDSRGYVIRVLAPAI